MADVDLVDQKELKRLVETVENVEEYMRPNFNRWHMFRKFTFKTSITEEDKTVSTLLNKPMLEFNMGEAYVSRLRGEFFKQEPSIEVMAAYDQNINPVLIKTVEGHMRSLLCDANNDSFEYDVYTDILTGGFSVIEVFPEYTHPMSIEQTLRVRRTFDPTLCGFDPMAQLSHKGDGQYFFKLTPMNKRAFEEKFGVAIESTDFMKNATLGHFNWYYATQKEDVVMVCDFYEKKHVKMRIVRLNNGETKPESEYKMLLKNWNKEGRTDLPPAQIGKPRDTQVVKIIRHRFIEKRILSTEETTFKDFPLIWVDGNSVMLRDDVNQSVQLMTRPYLYHAKDLQRLKNFAGQNLANSLENIVQHKFVIAKESIPLEQDYRDMLTNIQLAGTVIYNQYADNDPNKPLNPPREVQLVPAPPEVMTSFQGADGMMQAILGSYDASLGINEQEISGIALMEGASQSNAAAMPYVAGYLNGLNQVAQVALQQFPIIYPKEFPRSIPVKNMEGQKSFANINTPGGINFDYEDYALNVRVKAGVNFSVQKSRALQQIFSMCQASPTFAQFINSMCLDVLVDNMECKGADILKARAPVFMKQLQQQQNQPNPEMMKVQNEQMKIQHSIQQDQMDNQFRAQELQNQKQTTLTDAIRTVLQAQEQHDKSMVQLQKVNVEHFAKQAELAIEAHKTKHEIAHNHVKLAHEMKMNEMEQAQKMRETKQNQAKGE